MNRFLVLLCVLIVSSAWGQAPPSVSVRLAKPTAKPGAVVKGEVTVTFAEGWHAYQNPPTADYMIPVEIKTSDKTLKLKIKYPPGIMKKLAGEEKPIGLYEGSVVFPIEFLAPKKEGKAKISLEVHFQQCNDGGCLPPGVVNVSPQLTVKK